MVTRVCGEQLRVHVEAVFRAAGLTFGGARVMAETYVEADLRCIPGHGCRLVPGLLAKLRDGRLNARPRIAVERRDGVGVVLDADHAPGPLALRAATVQAGRRAEDCGVGLVAVRRSGHAGAIGIGATRLADRGLIGVVGAQTSAPSLALRGGTGAPVLGNSAFALAFPGGEHPVLVDLAAGPISWGRLHQDGRAGRELPDGLAVDQRGRHTRSHADAAALLPGNGRSQALALALELLVGVLTGSSPLPTGQEGRGLFCLAIDSARLTTTDHLAAGVEALARAVRDDGARMPGDRAWSARSAALTHGVALDDDVLDALNHAGDLPAGAPPLVPLTSARIGGSP